MRLETFILTGFVLLDVVVEQSMCSSIAVSANQEGLEERKQGISLSESNRDSDAFPYVSDAQDEVWCNLDGLWLSCGWYGQTAAAPALGGKFQESDVCDLPTSISSSH